jgi:hypothetical protein
MGKLPPPPPTVALKSARLKSASQQTYSGALVLQGIHFCTRCLNTFVHFIFVLRTLVVMIPTDALDMARICFTAVVIDNQVWSQQ